MHVYKNNITRFCCNLHGLLSAFTWENKINMIIFVPSASSIVIQPISPPLSRVSVQALKFVLLILQTK
jgi:hypothetical protein